MADQNQIKQKKKRLFFIFACVNLIRQQMEIIKVGEK
jgi:hypothetical protein